MCIPKAPTPVAAPLAPLLPTTAAASNLQLGGPGGVPRGAAALGRLQLRLGDSPTTSAPTPPTPAAPADITAAPTSSGGLTLGDSGNAGGSGVQRYNAATNPNIRLS